MSDDDGIVARLDRRARQLWSRLPADAAAGRLLDGAPGGLPAALREAQALLMRQQGRLWRRTAATAWALGQADPSLVGGIGPARHLARLARARRWEDTGLRLIAASAMLAVAACVLFGLGWSYGAWVGLFLPCLMALWPIYAALDDARFSFARAVAVVALARIGEPETAQDVAQAVTDTRKGKQTLGSGLVRRAAAASLPSALRRLSAEHYGSVSTRLSEALAAALPVVEPSVQRAVLRALLLVGRGADAEAVGRLLGRAPNGEVRELARRTLTVLEERRKAERDVLLLVRAGEAPPAGEALLRPAGSLVGPLEDRLLSPAEAPIHDEETAAS